MNGDFSTGTINAGADADLVSYAAVNAQVTAGKELYVQASGDVMGLYDAARDASVVTYGMLNATLLADRDIGLYGFFSSKPGVWAAGDILGVIVAGRSVGQASQPDYEEDFEDNQPTSAIRAYGQIDATIVALNTMSSTGGGYVGPVTASGPISGAIFADSRLESVESDDAILAMIVTPDVGGFVDFDAQLAASTPTAPPEPLGADFFDQLTADRNEIVATRDSIIQERDELLATAAAERLASLNNLNQQRFEAEAAYDQAVKDTNKVAQDLQDRVANIKAARDKKYQEATDFVAEVQTKVAAADVEMNQLVQQLKDGNDIVDETRSDALIVANSQQTVGQFFSVAGTQSEWIAKTLDLAMQSASALLANNELAWIGMKVVLIMPAIATTSPWDTAVESAETHGVPTFLL